MGSRVEDGLFVAQAVYEIKCGRIWGRDACYIVVVVVVEERLWEKKELSRSIMSIITVVRFVVVGVRSV